MHGLYIFRTHKLIQLPYKITSFDNFDMNQKLITNITKHASSICACPYQTYLLTLYFGNSILFFINTVNFFDSSKTAGLGLK